MRRLVHDAKVYFRVNQRVLEDAERRAEASGMSLAEFLRQALRRALEEAA
jgi:predicted HicB family RNase H-like nuclease